MKVSLQNTIVGLAELLEVIQSNSLLLNAQISLANSERNFILSQFNLKSVGLLNSEYQKLTKYLYLGKQIILANENKMCTFIL